MVEQGYLLFDHDPRVAAWADAALTLARETLADPDIRNAQLRHQGTWFVGVDTLGNALDGSVDGVPLTGPWEDHVALPVQWHRAQVSVVYPGYPQQDPDESDANHRYRINRFAAHVDGLLPEGTPRRRYLREPHAFILGLPLNHVRPSPLMVWPGSHEVMGAAFRTALEGQDPATVDVTDIYHSARRTCFDTIDPVPIEMSPGQSVLLQRHLLHGVAPWRESGQSTNEGRVVAYFRPQLPDARMWHVSL